MHLLVMNVVASVEKVKSAMRRTLARCHTLSKPTELGRARSRSGARGAACAPEAPTAEVKAEQPESWTRATRPRAQEQVGGNPLSSDDSRSHFVFVNDDPVAPRNLSLEGAPDARGEKDCEEVRLEDSCPEVGHLGRRVVDSVDAATPVAILDPLEFADCRRANLGGDALEVCLHLAPLSVGRTRPLLSSPLPDERIVPHRHTLSKP